MCESGFTSTSIPIRARTEAAAAPVINAPHRAVPASPHWGGALCIRNNAAMPSRATPHAGGAWWLPAGADTVREIVGTDNTLLELALCLPLVSTGRTLTRWSRYRGYVER